MACGAAGRLLRVPVSPGRALYRARCCSAGSGPGCKSGSNDRSASKEGPAAAPKEARPKLGFSDLRTVLVPADGYTYPALPSMAQPLEAARAEAARRLARAGTVGDGPEPSYSTTTDESGEGPALFEYRKPFPLDIKESPGGGVLPEFSLAFETWGNLSATGDNAILLHTGLSASAHAASSAQNPAPGWWEQFIGPGLALDTNKFYVICTNVLGGCFGSTGPSSFIPGSGGNTRYALSFPIVTVPDMVRAQFKLLDYLKIDRLHASVGSSMGGMQSLTAAAMYPDRVGRVASISAACRSHPTAIALRYMQRRVLMADPHWQDGNYYDGEMPVVGLKHAREIATISYRSGPEWEDRFGRLKVQTPAEPSSFLPEFLIESYLDHQGHKWIGNYDPNSLLYISKAMDLFDMGDGFNSLAEGVARVQCPTLVIGVQSDILFPISQQRELVELLRQGKNDHVAYYELNATFGHDTFLIDVPGISNALRGFL